VVHGRPVPELGSLMYNGDASRSIVVIVIAIPHSKRGDGLKQFACINFSGWTGFLLESRYEEQGWDVIWR
jgi:hypothetical protein